MKKTISIFIIAALISSVSPYATADDGKVWKYGLDGDKGFNESTYTTITRNEYSKNNVNQWRDGSMTGNGTMGVIESCDPAEDVFIFNNTKFVLGSNEVREVADISQNLEEIRKNVVEQKSQGAWQNWVKEWRNENYSVDTVSTNTQFYHPAAELRVRNNSYSGYDEYNRYTDWETGEVGMQWKRNGKEYNSRTFISRPDNIAVTIIEAPEGENLDLTLSIDNILEMNIDSAALKNKGILKAPESKEIVTKDNIGYSIGQIVKYGDFNIGGSDIPNGYAKTGYATATRILTYGGNISVSSRTETKTINKYFNTDDPSSTFSKDITTPYVNVSGTDKIMLLTRADRSQSDFTDVDNAAVNDGLTELESVNYYSSLLDGIDNSAGISGSGLRVESKNISSGIASATVRNDGIDEKTVSMYAASHSSDGTLEELLYSECTVGPDSECDMIINDDSIDENTSLYIWENGMIPVAEKQAEKMELTELYDRLLYEHAEGDDGHRAMFNSMEIDLGGDSADRELTNSQLQAKQNASKEEINAAWLERLYNNGRFALICASGYNTTRLGGIWTGSWMPDWSGDFTQDANVNLQISSVNTSNMKQAAHSYIMYILRQVSDWETNAKRIYGIDNAIMAGPRTDGDGNGQIYHSLVGYPFVYWNAGADWLLIPIYEYRQCYGNDKIPVGEDIDFEELRSVLSLNDDDIERIKNEGFDLENDILSPLITKLYNFWNGYVSDECYMSGDGTIHVYDGTTKGENDKYVFAPGYSPENVPSEDGTGYNGAASLAYNTTMDISAAHDSIKMVRELINDGVISNITADEASALEAQFPEYVINEDGALKEWADKDLEEHYNHRHVSHTYGAWPGYEAYGNEELSEAIANALDMRYAYNLSDYAQAHGHLHNAMVEARVGRVYNYEEQLLYLIANDYQYKALMTSHNHRHGSAFCTDNACGLCGVVNEGLIYSDTGKINILPALPNSLNQGYVKNMMSRSQARIDELSWDLAEKKATVTITSQKEGINNIELSCGREWTSADINSGGELDGSKVSLALNKGESVTVSFTLGEDPQKPEPVKTESFNIIQTDDTDISSVNIGKTVKFRAVDFVPAKAKINEVLWSVSAQDGTPISSTKITAAKDASNNKTWYNDAVLTIGTDALGKTLLVCAQNEDGSFVSNSIQVTVADVETEDTVIECESYEYGFGSYKLESGNDYSGSGAVGTISGTTVLKYSNVDLSNLLSMTITRKKYTQPAKVRVYCDLDETINNSSVYWDDFSNDSGEGKGGASRRYTIDEVNIDEEKLISESVSIASGVETAALNIDSRLNGKHNLYIVIDRNGETWAGNYDYLTLTYQKGIRQERLEAEDLTYGFGNFKNEITNIGTVNNKAVLKFDNISFDNLYAIGIVKTEYSSNGYISAYKDLDEASEKTLYTYDKDNVERDYRFNMSDVNVDAQKCISDRILMNNSETEGILSVKDGIAGTGAMYLYLEKNTGTWWGNIDYIVLYYTD